MGFWGRGKGRPQDQSWWQDFKRAAKAHSLSLGPISVVEVQASLKCFRPVIGMGVDKANPRWWLQLPQD
eukprot:8517569-Pyramimonas_sp.AAC.1